MIQLQFYGEIQSDRVQGFSGRIYGPSSYLEAGAISRKEITVKIFTATNVPAAPRRSVRVSGNWTRRTFLRNVARGKNCKKLNFHQNYSEEQSIRRLRSMGWSGLVPGAAQCQCRRIFAFAASDKIGQLRRMAAAGYKSTMTCLSQVSSNSDLCGINGE